MMEPINVPFGLCDVAYGDMELPAIGEEGVFTAIPTYQKMFGGAGNTTQGYILTGYDVKLTVSVQVESYEAFKLHMPTMQDHEHGLFDAPRHVNMSGERLIIHPKINNTREYDICLWDAYISPETEFLRTFGKQADKFEITFIGKRVEAHSDTKLVDSYFFIGDWEEVLMIKLFNGIKDLLQENVNEENLTLNNNLFINHYPDNPDTVVSVIDLGGTPPPLYFRYRDKVLEVKFRAKDKEQGYKIGEEIFDLLHDKENYYFGDLRVMHSFARTDVNYLFEDNFNRFEFTIEFIFKVQR